MPSVNDIVDAIDMMSVDAVIIDEDRCSACRNRNSKCNLCAEACVSKAIQIKRRKVEIDSSVCVNCGCCASVCPTDALSMVSPTKAQTFAQIVHTADSSSGCAVVACARKAARNEGDPERYAEVPCLGHIHDVELLSIASAGFDDIVLVDGCCNTCKFRAASSVIDSSIESAISLLESVNAGVIITRSSDFPPEILAQDNDIRGKSRRGLAAQTGNYVKMVAKNVAKKTLEEQLGKTDSAEEKRRRRIAAGGKVSTFEPTSNYEAIDCIEALSKRQASSGNTAQDDACATHPNLVRSKRFANISIDVEACSGCGICVLSCPTDALVFDDFDEPSEEGMRFVEFRPYNCMQCMLCRDVCLRKCVQIQRDVEISRLKDPAPTLITIPLPNHGMSAFSFGM